MLCSRNADELRNALWGTFMKLQRKLSRPETLALSMAVIAMMVGASLNTPFVAKSAGTSVPLVFIISTIGVLCIAHSFIRLSRIVGHAGSVYGLIRYAQGPTAGFFAGWALLMTYGIFVSAALFGFGYFAVLLTESAGSIPWWVFSLASGAIVWIFVYRDIKISARVMLAIEISAILLLILVAVIILRSQPASMVPFKVGDAGWTGISQALVFGLLTFIGFEAAASLGEESNNPSSDIPFAILSTVLLAGAFFTFISYAQTIGYGLDKVADFQGSSSPTHDLSMRFGGPVLTALVTTGALISTFAMAIGSGSAAARLLLTFGRDGYLPQSLASVNVFGSPKAATHLIMLLNAVLIIGLAAAGSYGPFDLYGFTGVIATLTVLIAYAMMGFGELQHFAASDIANGRFYRIVPPVIGILLSAYALLANVYPVPDPPFNYFPYVVFVYMALGGLIWLASGRQERGQINDYVVSTEGTQGD